MFAFVVRVDFGQKTLISDARVGVVPRGGSFRKITSGQALILEFHTETRSLCVYCCISLNT